MGASDEGFARRRRDQKCIAAQAGKGHDLCIIPEMRAKRTRVGIDSRKCRTVDQHEFGLRIEIRSLKWRMFPEEGVIRSSAEQLRIPGMKAPILLQKIQVFTER